IGALAEPGLQAAVHPLRVVTLSCQEDHCQWVTAYGSAVSIGPSTADQELFLTAAHCVAGKIHRLEIGIQRQWYPATVLARKENQADIAVLGVRSPGVPIQAVKLAETGVAQGSQVTLTGFPNGGAYRRREGTVIPSRYRNYDLVVNLPSVPGESGGGIFNSQGELVGITSATAPAHAPTHTLATGIASIRGLLGETLPTCPPCFRSPPKPQGQDIAARIAELQTELTRLRVRLAALETQRPQPGPPGPTGPQGEPGSTDPAILHRLERLEQTQIPVQILSPDGIVLDESRYHLGEPLQFRLIPKRE
ncbi:MAG: trypsin-like peptidase domain-containing protein, partial [Planctomycetaceae bacterium]|nr:trypsin-like peptidase domain-containing protein [Planctomycetaceae bacterium]